MAVQVSFMFGHRGGAAVGHPVNVAFFSRDNDGQVSPLIYCPYGGEYLLQDLRVALDLCGIPGAAEVSREIFLHWALKYGKRNVCAFNLGAPGIVAGASAAETFRASLAYLRELVSKSDEFAAVDLDEFVLEHRRGSQSLERDGAEPSPVVGAAPGSAAEPGAAPDTAI
ncbi:hypothetical protein GobsT_44290 [Gemmata obscuriglobus]|nr:hypothetical protein GobsT_44290 [Gemmata obscuriglobus]VTS08943.1 unnamed protein product [Gemmata obscuriglobus UQM 2246]